MKRNEKNGIVYYTFENLEGKGRGLITHAFSTRIGGISEGHFSSMNLGLRTNDDIKAVRQNYRLFCDALGFDMDNIVCADQYHTTNIHKSIHAPDADFFSKRNLEHIDGHTTNVPGLTLVTYYADCVPLLFFDPVLKVIANSHAGWRGSMHNIAAKTAAKMVNDYGCNTHDILVGIGPSISCKNFEVGPEVAEEFKCHLPSSAEFIYSSETKPDKYHIDLWEINRQNLIASGLKPENIEIAGLCTYDDANEFYSHRRDGGLRGSLAAFISLNKF